MDVRTVHTETGRPLPLGPTCSAGGVNFALFSRHARSVALVFRDQISGPLQEISLDPALNKTGDIWHIFLKTEGQPICYGYRIEHQLQPGQPVDGAGHLVVDPYCRQHLPRSWGTPSKAGKEPVCLAIPPAEFDWQGDRPLRIPASDTIIYELHVRGFTRHPSAQVQAPGTFAGIVEKIPYLKDLGITAVELLPVTEWDETDNRFVNPASGERLLNYWGYNPLSFFALRSGLAATPEKAVNEFKQMVKSLHQAGIEVILDLVFNHTGESDLSGTTSSFRAIDNQLYYLIDRQTNDYLNFSGCGNTVNTNHPVVCQMIVEALRYFVSEFHIDGFRFDLAAIFNRAQDGSPTKNSPLVEMIAEDPLLRASKLIAEAWDAAGLYQVGSFSSNRKWREWNGRYRDDVRTFMAGRSDSVRNLATRIAGSSDLYQDDGRGPLNSVNFITCHDGFTLYDLVSYNRKYNEANGENNRDGENHNLSWNSGFEGAPAPERIERIRRRRIKTMAALLFLSQGVPMLCAGDEIGRTQQGNNNGWCQDNEISWFNWGWPESGTALLDFFRKCIDLRSRYAAFRREDFFKNSDLPPDILWQSLIPGIEDWSPHCRELGFLLNGEPSPGDSAPAFFIMINGRRQTRKSFTIPHPAHPHDNRVWARIVDTALPGPDDFVAVENAPHFQPGADYPVEPMALAILQTV
jgi:isoamylase